MSKTEKKVGNEVDAKSALREEYRKEREINAGANASKYHKERFVELSKLLGKTDGDGKVEKPKDEPKSETVATETVSTQSNDTEAVAVTGSEDSGSRNTS